MFKNFSSLGMRWSAYCAGLVALFITTTVTLHAQSRQEQEVDVNKPVASASRIGDLPVVADKSLITFPEDGPEGEVLPLRVAVQKALGQNLGLRVEAFNQAISFESMAIEDAVFDSSLFASVDFYKQELTSTRALASGTSTDNRQYGAGIRKKLSTGATAELSTGLSRRDSNAALPLSSLDYSADFTASITQPLLRGGWKTVNLAGLAKAKSRHEATRLQLKSTIATQIESTENYYWNLAYAYANRKLRESSREAARNLLTETEERQRIGMASDVDVLQARASLASREDAIVSATQQIEDAQDTLARQIGLLQLPEANTATATPPMLAVSSLPDTASATPDFSAVWERTVVWDPSTGVQEETINQGEIDRRVAKNGLQPSLDLTMAASLLGSDSKYGRQAYENAASNDGREWRTGLTLSYPWGNRGDKARLRQTEKSIEQEKLRLIDLKQGLYQEVRSTWRQAEAARVRMEYTVAAMELQERNHLQQVEKYRIGLATLREVIEAQRDLDDARLTRLNASLSLIRARTALARLDGTILERHGFTWDEASTIVESPSANP
ncbi:MAG: TolC family protein [Verrucomicrobiota bacterium]|nr:TolC family protein [Verrucomicrobiota bacterium]